MSIMGALLSDIKRKDPERYERIMEGLRIEQESYPEWKQERDMKAVKEFANSEAFQHIVQSINKEG